jgi:hypothetical protein
MSSPRARTAVLARLGARCENGRLPDGSLDRCALANGRNGSRPLVSSTELARETPDLRRGRWRRLRHGLAGNQRGAAMRAFRNHRRVIHFLIELIACAAISPSIFFNERFVY